MMPDRMIEVGRKSRETLLWKSFAGMCGESIVKVL